MAPGVNVLCSVCDVRWPQWTPQAIMSTLEVSVKLCQTTFFSFLFFSFLLFSFPVLSFALVPNTPGPRSGDWAVEKQTHSPHSLWFYRLLLCCGCPSLVYHPFVEPTEHGWLSPMAQNTNKAPMCRVAHFISVCQRKQTWDRTTCWSNAAQTRGVVTGCVGVGGGGAAVAPDGAEIENIDAKKDTHDMHKGPSWVITFHLYWQNKEREYDIKITPRSLSGVHAQSIIFCFVFQTIPVMIMFICRCAQILWRSFCLFPRTFPKHGVRRCLWSGSRCWR